MSNICIDCGVTILNPGHGRRERVRCVKHRQEWLKQKAKDNRIARIAREMEAQS